MGGCASKNKQPKEEAYKPASPPPDQAQFEEIVPEEKPAVASKPPMKLNGSVAEGDKKKNEYRNSLVGPGGVILPNQPEVKDEADPSIPYIDASEDELDDEQVPRPVKEVQPTVTAALEPVTVAGIEAVAAEIPEVLEKPEVPKIPEVPKAPEVSETQEVHEMLQAQKDTVVSGAAEVIQDTDPAKEVKHIEEDVAAATDELSSRDLVNDTGESFVDEVLRGVGQGSFPCSAQVEAVAEDVGKEAKDAASSSVNAVEESMQNGIDVGEEELRKAVQPAVEGVQNIHLDAGVGGIIQMGQESVVEFKEEKEFTGFRDCSPEDTDLTPTDEQIASVSESVGVIISPYVSGAGFRVGEKHIMTTYHLIREMFDKMAAQGIMSPEQHILGNKDVWIQFEYVLMGEYEFENPTRFRFARFCYSNPQLDVIIIELETYHDKTLPPPLVNFCGLGKRHKVEFVGHNGAPKNRRGPSNLIHQPTDDEVQKAVEWCKKQGFPSRGYDGLKSSNKQRFHCAFQNFTFGCPGVVVNNDDVFVVVVLTKGYPSFYLDVDSDQQESIPDSLKVVEGASMSDVYLDMKDQPNLAELCANVFGLSVSKQQS